MRISTISIEIQHVMMDLNHPLGLRRNLNDGTEYDHGLTFILLANGNLDRLSSN